MERLQKIVKKKGGEVISAEYTSRKKLRFRCKENHKWWAQVYNIYKGAWCPRCGNKTTGRKLKKSFFEVLDFAKLKNGKCLSKKSEYENVGTSLKWKCERGHIFRETFHNVRRRAYWCRRCRLY